MNSPLGPQEIAALLRVQTNTVHVWRQRGVLPAPSWIVSGVPLWERSQIEVWARQTRRMPTQAEVRGVPSS